jgi:hypothetical protein
MMLTPLLMLLACGSSDGTCEVIESGEDRIVVGFWETDDCSGETVATNSFPVSESADCYCWPGSSGENSADTFTCNGDGSFTYTQYGSLDCGLSDDTPTEKTVYSTECRQDIPPTIYAMVLDDAACP